LETRRLTATGNNEEEEEEVASVTFIPAVLHAHLSVTDATEHQQLTALNNHYMLQILFSSKT
jgi:hypothetical protein